MVREFSNIICNNGCTSTPDLRKRDRLDVNSVSELDPSQNFARKWRLNLINIS